MHTCTCFLILLVPLSVYKYKYIYIYIYMRCFYAFARTFLQLLPACALISVVDGGKKRGRAYMFVCACVCVCRGKDVKGVKRVETDVREEVKSFVFLPLLFWCWVGVLPSFFSFSAD